MIHEQHVLAPLDRLVAAAEHLMRPLAAEEVRLLEARPHDVAQTREAERDAILLAKIAQLDQAQHRRGVQPGDGAEIEHHIAHGLVPLRLDGALDALEQAVGGAEEDEAREPEHVNALALLAQQPRLLRRALDIAGEFLPRQVAPDHADTAIAQREHQAGADHADHHAHEIAKIDDDQRHHAGKRPFHPRALRGRFPQLDEDHRAEISQHAGENGFRHHAADIGAGEQNDGADNADNGAGPARGGARLVEQQASVHRQRSAEAAEHRRQEIGETVGAELLVEIAGLLPRHLQARHVEQERNGHHAAE